VDYVQLPVTQAVNTNLLIDFNPPAGMTLIPAGVFTMGDTLDGETDAIPVTNVNVSAFYMDVNLVSLSQWQSVYAYATNHG
jgi:formylglycine-generating enzyme required for sulfatase activity